MIKGGLFGKLLKQLFIISLISCFGLLVGSFASANYKIYEVSLDKSVSQSNGNYSIGFLPKGRFLTDYLGTTKAVIGLNNQSLVWWGKNGRLYLFDNAGTVYGGVLQGFFNYYSSCDYFYFNSTGVSNCTTPEIWSSEIITNFLDKVQLGDYVYINRNSSRLGCGGYCTYDYFTFDICFSSIEIGSSLCFKMDKSTGGTSPSHGTKYPLINSQSLSSDTNFGNLAYSFIGDSPALGNSDSGISNGYENTVCPTVGQLLSYYDSSLYYTGVCYSPSIIYTGGQFQQVVPSSIFDLFTDLNDFKAHLQLYGNYCNSVSTLCQDAFFGKDLQYLYIANLNQNLRSTEKDVYQYCNLALNHSPNESSCVSSGVLQDGSQLSRDDVIGSLGNGGYSIVLPITGLVNGDTTVFNAFSFNSQYTGDVIDNIQILFTKFTSLFSQQTGNSTGILPKFFLIFFIAFVLFKLFKMS